MLHTVKAVQLFVVLFTLWTSVSYSQDTLRYPIQPNFDPTLTNPQSFDLGDPSSVQQSIVYDPVTGKYIFSETIGNGLYYRNPSMMTLDEYIEYERQRAQRENWKERIDQQTAENQPLEFPIKIDSKVFENFFGSDQITIRPQGSVELSFGVNSSRYDNPILPVKQRRITRFDFQQNIQLNLVGQIGTRLKLGASYNTQAAFDFDNVSKLEYTGDEDQIVQKIALGNVSMQLPTSLIQGSQTLFGAYTQLKFGRASVDLIAASSKGKRQEITVSGQSQVQRYELSADNYEANRHYFANLYFHEHYDEAMQTLPIVNSGVNVTRMEVYVTNRTSSTENTRNILAFADLGEAKAENLQGNPGNLSPSELPDNEANGLYAWASTNPMIRGFSNSVLALSSQVVSPGPFVQAVDYEKVENARKLTDAEFSYNAQLGYISLNIPLNNDEVLAVAYEYTLRGETYQVGEFSTDGIEGRDALILKLLKPTITNPKNKIWDLMMKNVYSIGAYQLDQVGFRLDILYNNPENSLYIPFFPVPGLDDKQLVTTLEMDKLNQMNQPFSDGVFDFAPMVQSGNRFENGGTINARNGRLYFSTIEPFGKTLGDKLINAGYSQLFVDQVAYTELYDSTKTAAQQIPSKNRFYFKGEYQSSISSDIPLNALNVPEGAVSVTAGGIKLTEGVDYSVDYNLGRVKILNEGLLASNKEIKIAIESNSVFGFQAKSLLGARYAYRFSQNFNVGATWMRMMERPVTQKVDIGSEPFKNNIIGFDLAYKTELPFLTKAVDFLPLLSTKEKSTFSFSGEFAHLIPGSPRAINKTGTSYVDDFEGAQSNIDLRSFGSWRLASIPQGQNDLFPEAVNKNLSAGFNRAKTAWYVIDPLFFQQNNLTPEHIKNDPSILSDSRMRMVNQTDIFPNLQQQYGSFPNIPILELAYYPTERGMYNYDTTSFITADGLFTNPQRRWGGIMRALTTNDFELANIQYIQFWVLDPFNGDAEDANPNSAHSGGDLYFNLGNISEDILPDSRKSYENGLPPDGVALVGEVDTTSWARIPNAQVTVNAFDNDPASRLFQDVGLDGWNSNEEKTQYADYVNWINSNPTLNASAKAKLLSDVSSDNYTYYLDDNYDAQQLNILQRYKRYNGMEGNSPTIEMSDTANVNGYPTQGTNQPDIEDINQDNNLSETENYFQYHISLRPNDMVVGKNYITNVQTYNNGNKVEKWYQFKIPIEDFEKRINGIQDFRSIRFMRIFMNNFDEEVLLRFARLELIRGEWRRYLYDLSHPGEGVVVDPNLTSFNIGAVNVEENDQRQPINYKIPPGIIREVDPSQQIQRQLNEQSITLEVCNLQDGDARAAYKNVTFDVRTYKKLKMFVHAEGVPNQPVLNNDDLTMFVRLGTDFTDNYYEYELPMKVTQFGESSDVNIWPEDNNMEIVFQDLLNLKKRRNELIEAGNAGISYTLEFVDTDPANAQRRIKVKGSPNLQGIKTIMIGMRNPSSNEAHPWTEDGLAKCAIVWVNELRLTDFISEGGSAAIAQMQVQAADFANVTASGNYSGFNWGSVESRVQERQLNEKIGFDFNANMQLGQFFGKQFGLSLPFFYGYSLGLINPEYDPFNPDIRLTEYSFSERREKLRSGQDFTERRSYNFTNVRKQLKAGAKPHFWRISNWAASYAYSENLHRDFNLNYDRTKTWTGALNYNYSFQAKPIEPFKKMKFMGKSKWWSIVRDINFYPTPKNIAFSNDLLRSYNERQVRNNIVPDYEFAPVYLKRFTWNRRYNVGYDIMKNLKLTFSATNQAIFEEADGRVDRKVDPTGYRMFKDSIISQMSTFGKTMNYAHDYSLNYNLPLNKIPLLDWTSASIKYGGSYNWLRAPLAQTEFGNIIQNNRTVNMQAQLNFTNLYNKVPYFKKVLSDGRATPTRRSVSDAPVGGRNTNDKQATKGKTIPDPVPPKPVEEMTEKEKKKWERVLKRHKRKVARLKRRENKVNPIAGFFTRVLLSVRNVSGTYALNDGTLLPGYNQGTSVLGMNSLNSTVGGFAFGKQRYDLWGRETSYNIAERVEGQNWLVRNENLNKAYTFTHSKNLTLRSSLEPMKDLTVELNMNRTFGNNSSEFYRWNETSQQFESQSRVETGTLTYTNITWGSAFALIQKDYSSKTFQNLLDNRKEVSSLYGSSNANSNALASGYFKGYSGSQQEVVMGAFLTAYSSKAVNDKNVNPVKNIPLPNWSINYNGLTKMEFMKKYVRQFVVRHAYSSTVSVSGLQTNLNAAFDQNGNASAFDINNNFIAARQIQNVVISERFSPLIGFDATWLVKDQGLITKFEYKKDRSATLSLNNNQVTEILGNEWVIGTGYRFPKVQLPFKSIKPSDINFRFDFSFRDNLTVIRKVVENTNQATAGQRVISIKSSADYSVGQFLVVMFYYDHVLNTPKIATSYPTGNMSTGIRLRYNLAGVQ